MFRRQPVPVSDDEIGEEAKRGRPLRGLCSATRTRTERGTDPHCPPGDVRESERERGGGALTGC